MPELKPCPFCGGAVRIAKRDEEKTYFIIRCTCCHMDFGRRWYPLEHYKDIVEAWNRRADDA